MAFYPGGLASSHDEFLNTIINSFKYRMIQTWVSLFLSEFHSPDYIQLKYMIPFQNSDLEKVASGASGACGNFVRNPAILRAF